PHREVHGLGVGDPQGGGLRATYLEMQRRIGDFFSSAAPDDVLLFYYSGHGRPDLSGNFYLCTKDTDTTAPFPLRMPGSELAEMITQSPARLKIVILDCCYAGDYKGGGWSPPRFPGTGTFVLAAARRGTPLVPDAPNEGALSPFTAALVEALRRDDLDLDGDGYITADDVARHLSARADAVPHAPFALQRWTGTGIVPIARTRRIRQPDRGTREHRNQEHRATEELAGIPADCTTAAAPPTSTAVPGFSPPKPWPELLPVPPHGATEFCLSRHLVTNGQFRAFLDDPVNARWRPETARGAGRYADGNYLRHWDRISGETESEHLPVVAVSADAARAYATWAGAKVGRPLRLPTRAEWEQAVAAGRDGDWAAQDVGEGRVNFLGTLAALSEVGEFEANPYGLCDLLGNAWDLCLDEKTGTPELRGGAFDTPAERLRERLPLVSPVQCRANAGFRCAC
ncbi:SUMF1/EgtB/PvdO family nonheme iron enzyme, partial [Streptomyces sp. NPDC003832]